MNENILVNSRFLFFSTLGKEFINLLEIKNVPYTLTATNISGPDLASAAGVGVYIFSAEDFSDKNVRSRLESALQANKTLVLIGDREKFENLRYHVRNFPNVVVVPCTDVAGVLKIATSWCAKL
jgi:hypothetical protein